MGWFPAGRVGLLQLFKEKKKNSTWDDKLRRQLGKLEKRERRWGRGAAFAAFSPLQFSGHLREFWLPASASPAALTGSFCWDPIPGRAPTLGRVLAAAAALGHSGAVLQLLTSCF